MNQSELNKEFLKRNNSCFTSLLEAAKYWNMPVREVYDLALKPNFPAIVEADCLVIPIDEAELSLKFFMTNKQEVKHGKRRI